MFYDAPLVLSSAQPITTTAASTNLYDVTGAGSGVAPTMTFGNGDIGFDIAGGVNGIAHPTAYWTVTTNGTGTGTIAFAVQAAPDNGSNAPGTYTTLAQTEAYIGTTLDVGDVIELPIPPYNKIKAGMGVPRFYRFEYIQTGDGAVSVTGAIVINPQTGYEVTQYGNNFASA
mgnify:FL=1